MPKTRCSSDDPECLTIHEFILKHRGLIRGFKLDQVCHDRVRRADHSALPPVAVAAPQCSFKSNFERQTNVWLGRNLVFFCSSGIGTLLIFWSARFKKFVRTVSFVLQLGLGMVNSVLQFSTSVLRYSVHARRLPGSHPPSVFPLPRILFFFVQFTLLGLYFSWVIMTDRDLDYTENLYRPTADELWSFVSL